MWIFPLSFGLSLEQGAFGGAPRERERISRRVARTRIGDYRMDKLPLGGSECRHVPQERGGEKERGVRCGRRASPGARTSHLAFLSHVLVPGYGPVPGFGEGRSGPHQIGSPWERSIRVRPSATRAKGRKRPLEGWPPGCARRPPLKRPFSRRVLVPGCEPVSGSGKGRSSPSPNRLL